MKKQGSSPDAVMAVFINKCSAHLEQETKRLGRWPDRLQLPEPRNDMERRALELWIKEIKEATGGTMRLESANRPGAEGEGALKTTETRKIGVITVDAGLCWIGDPCYILHQDALPETIGKSWSDFIDRLGRQGPTLQQFHHDAGHPGLGVVVGAGDGVYPVHAEIRDGRVIRVWVEFLPG